MAVNADMPVEELVAVHPKIAPALADRGLVCFRCGEAFWGTLRELAAQSSLQDRVDQIVAEVSAQLDLEPPTA